MRDYKWRTSPSGTEGTNTVYVDSYTGSDQFGDGKRNNPYQTLLKAYTAKTSTPGTIVCRGTFSEDITGNHSCSINGDYYGAAVFDGLDTYIPYAFSHNRMIIRNVPASTLPSSLLAGVGRAGDGASVGNADDVDGVAGSSALLARCAMYMGVLGSTCGTANKYIVFASPQCNISYRISNASSSASTCLNNTYHGCRITNRQKHYSQNSIYQMLLYSDFDMIANDAGNDKYYCCLFAADCKWYYLTGNNTDSTYYELTVTGTTSADRQASLLAALEAKYDELGIAESSRKRPSFYDCVFSTQTAAQLFNNHAQYDFTLRPGCDADRHVSCLSNEGQYIGAMPPAINVAIKDSSDGEIGTWDEHTASGCVKIDGNKICLDTDSVSDYGEVISKIISINPLTTQINGVYAEFATKFRTYKAYANKDDIFEATEYAIGDALPVGRFMMTEDSVCDGVSISAGNMLVTTTAGSTFTSAVATAKAVQVKEPNVMDVIYCRCRTTVYARVGTTDALQAGATYLNDSDETITYHGRSIVKGESFVCITDGETFSAPTGTTKIAVMFDDTRVPAADWCPAQIFGEYFVAKESGTIKKDSFGIPLSSGNYMAYQSGTLYKSTMDRMYIQFAVKVNRYV